MLPPTARKLRAQSSELDKLARAGAKLIGDRAPEVIKLRCEAEILRQQVAAWLAQNVDRILASPQGRWLYAEYLGERYIYLKRIYPGQNIPVVRFGGYASHSEIINEARALWFHSMNLLAASKHPELCRLFDELYTLWRTRQHAADRDKLDQDGLDGVNCDLLFKWARRWHLVGLDGEIPNWVLGQVAETFHFWGAIKWREKHAPLCWPGITSDFWGYPALSPEEQQRAEQFCREHPSFCPLTVRNREEWHLHRHFARVAGMRVAPRVPLAHFVWTCRYQFGQERACDIAESPEYGLPGGCMHKRYTRQDVYHAIRKVLGLIGLAARRDKPGPRRRSRSRRDS